jgi:hypothetical protein
VREFVFGKRLAGLLQGDGVRLHHHQSLYKDPRGGITLAHADPFYWLLAGDRTITSAHRSGRCIRGGAGRRLARPCRLLQPPLQAADRHELERLRARTPLASVSLRLLETGDGIANILENLGFSSSSQFLVLCKHHFV